MEAGRDQNFDENVSFIEAVSLCENFSFSSNGEGAKISSEKKVSFVHKMFNF